jgi:flagellar biogenesis protein FliO
VRSIIFVFLSFCLTFLGSAFPKDGSVWASETPAIASEKQLSLLAAAESPLEQEPYRNLPFKKNEGVSTRGLMTSYVMLMLLLIAGIAVLWAVRRRLQRRGSLPMANGQRLRYQERCRLNARTQVYVVSVGQDDYLIADNGQGIAIQPLPKSLDSAPGESL